MATRGFLIRFIDIGLIVLFGFLMISDIEASSRVDLGSAAEVLEEVPETPEEQGFVLVEVAADGSFVVSEAGEGGEFAAAGGSAAADSADNVEAGEAADTAAALRVRVQTVQELEEAVAILRDAHRRAGLETVVLIEPHPSSAVQRTVDAMDVSDRLGLTKSLRMDIDVVRGGGGP